MSVTTVPRSTEAFAIDSAGTDGNADYKIAVREGSRWRLIKAPKLNGRYGTLNSLGAGSKRTVWLGGGRQVGGNTEAGIQETPTIWRWKGGTFHRVNIGQVASGAASISSIAASGPDNAWAVGEVYSVATGFATSLHWDGNKWSQVPIPTQVALESVTTSSAKNAWALDDGGNLLHWDGSVWTSVAAAPSGVYFFQIAQGPGKTLYAIGGTSLSTYFMMFNGTSWSNVKLGKHKRIGGYDSISTHGRSGWVVARVGSKSVVLHSSGGKWTVQFAPKSKYRLDAVSAASPQSATLVGDIYSRADAAVFLYAAATAGHGWHNQSVP
jgi:hypothetical protein